MHKQMDLVHLVIYMSVHTVWWSNLRAGAVVLFIPANSAFNTNLGNKYAFNL